MNSGKLHASIRLATVAVVLFAHAHAWTAAPDTSTAIQDWKQLVQAYEEFRETLAKFDAPQVFDNYETRLSELESFEKKAAPRLQKLIDGFGAKYGTTAMAIDNMLHSLNVPRDAVEREAGRTFEIIQRALENAKAMRVNTGAALLASVDSLSQNMSFYAETERDRKYDEFIKKLELAAAWDPNNADIKKKLNALRAERKTSSASLERQRDQRTWPGNYKDFAGPGNVNELLAASRKFLTTNPEWSKEKFIAVCIKGDWWSVKRNILGETVEWGLPVLAAFEDPKDPRNARVFSLSMVNIHAKREPPFTYAAVGDNYTMRKANIRGGRGGGGSGYGLVGRVLRLALALACIAGGLLAAAPLLRTKAPGLANLYDQLQPVRSLLGVIVLMVGIACLVRVLLCLVLLRFVVFQDILPQVAAIAVGLLLGKELLLHKPPVTLATTVAESTDDTPQKTGAVEAATLRAQELLAKHDARIAVLEKYQVPIGIVAIVLGVLHLLLGGYALI
jgi:hypothetical protein